MPEDDSHLSFINRTPDWLTIHEAVDLIKKYRRSKSRLVIFIAMHYMGTSIFPYIFNHLLYCGRFTHRNTK